MGAQCGCPSRSEALAAAAASGEVYTEHSYNARWEQTNKKLGTGGFSEVFLVVNKRTGQRAAAKVMAKGGMSPNDIKAVMEEVHIMRQLQHPNIVKFIDMFDEQDKMYVIMEYLAGGALFDRVVSKDHYSEKDARDLVYIFLSSLKFMHERDIVHRDIKPENLLMSSTSDDADVKIADFGLSIHLPNGELCFHPCGTPNYIAPEMLTKKGYSKPVDMWAVGCIAFILLGGYCPFDTGPEDRGNKKLYSLIKEGRFSFDPSFWGGVSEEAKNLIAGLLRVDPRKRLTVEQALQHPWVVRAGSELAARNLQENLKNFKAFLGKRKFKAAVTSVMATNKFKSLLSGRKSSQDDLSQEISPSEKADILLDDADEGGTSPADVDVEVTRDSDLEPAPALSTTSGVESAATRSA